MPRAIAELLERNRCRAAEDPQNLAGYGNTSSASMLIAAAEWWRDRGGRIEAPAVFAASGAGLNWGAMLARPT